MKATSLRLYPEYLRTDANDLGLLRENTVQIQDTLMRAWERLDAGWEDYAESGIQASYGEAMNELGRIITMLDEMDAALVQTADKIEAADHGATALFSFDASAGETPGAPILPPYWELPPGYTTPGNSSGTPPSDNFCPIPNFPIFDPDAPFTLGYTTPMPGSSTLTIPTNYWLESGSMVPPSAYAFAEDVMGRVALYPTYYDLYKSIDVAARTIAGNFRLAPGTSYPGQIIVYGSHDAKNALELSPYLTHMKGFPASLTPGGAALRAISSKATAVGLGITYGVDIFEFAWGSQSDIGLASSEFVSTITTDTVISLGLPAAGAAIGTAIFPGPGTAVGGAVGLIFSIIWSVGYRDTTVTWVDTYIFDPAEDFISNQPPANNSSKEKPKEEPKSTGTPTPPPAVCTETIPTDVEIPITAQPNPTPPPPSTTPTP